MLRSLAATHEAAQQVFGAMSFSVSTVRYSELIPGWNEFSAGLPPPLRSNLAAATLQSAFGGKGDAMNELRFTLTVRIDGENAGDVADDLRIDADGGAFDLPIVQLLRAHLAINGDTRDWQIVSAVLHVDGEVTP